MGQPTWRHDRARVLWDRFVRRVRKLRQALGRQARDQALTGLLGWSSRMMPPSDAELPVFAESHMLVRYHDRTVGLERVLIAPV